jgi:hypothetical protein
VRDRRSGSCANRPCRPRPPRKQHRRGDGTSLRRRARTPQVPHPPEKAASKERQEGLAALREALLASSSWGQRNRGTEETSQRRDATRSSLSTNGSDVGHRRCAAPAPAATTLPEPHPSLELLRGSAPPTALPAQRPRAPGIRRKTGASNGSKLKNGTIRSKI